MFENLAIMLGGFHLLMMLLGVMGMRFGDAGLREIEIQSGAVAEGSIEKVLEGKSTIVLCDFRKSSVKH